MTRIRCYELLDPLGPQGQYCTTYLARNHDRPSVPYCVVKQLHQPPFPKVLDLFQREAVALDRLGQHSHIPALIASFAEGDHFYLVQEYIEGHDLSQEVGPGKTLREAQVRTLLHQVLTLLTFVHGQGMIHRDIKPSNLIRRLADGEICLIDFGVVREISRYESNRWGQIRTLTVAGTTGYMAPEQQRGNPCFASDLYSLGMVAVVALTGADPQTLSTDPDTGRLVWVDRLTRSPEDVALVPFIDRLVATHRKHRPASAALALEDFDRCLGEGRTAIQARSSQVNCIPTDPVPTNVVAPGNPNRRTTVIQDRLPWDGLFQYGLRGVAFLLTLAVAWGLGLKAKTQWDWWWYARQRPPVLQPRYPEASDRDLVCLFDWDNCRVRLHAEVINPYWAMTQAARAEGILFWCAEGFQSIEQQKNTGNPRSEAVLVRTLNESDYHTGFTVVLSLQAPDDRRPVSRREFERSPAFRWLQENASRYGFALAYPPGHRNYEPWRWRYVGTGSIFKGP